MTTETMWSKKLSADGNDCQIIDSPHACTALNVSSVTECYISLYISSVIWLTGLWGSAFIFGPAFPPWECHLSAMVLLGRVLLAMFILK